MPRLREYKPSSKKSGYYIRANVGGSHPVTLQVTTIAQVILQQTGYKSSQSVPTKLVWAMYDLDLVYTNKSLDPSNVKNVSTEEILQDLDLSNNLSNSEQKRLISYIEEYEGPQKGKLTQLKQELKTASSGNQGKISSNGHTKVEDVPENVDEAISYIYTLTHNVDRYQRVKKQIDKTYLLRSLQTFVHHPYADVTKAKISHNHLIRYPITHPDKEITCWVRDHRGQAVSHQHQDTDYECRIFDEEGDAVAIVEKDQITDFTPAANGRYNIQELQSDLDWILPPEPVEIDDIEHNKKDGVENNTFTEYNGRKLRAIREVQDKESMTVQIAKVDRISTGRNPVIEIDGKEHILDKGKPGEEYLVEDTGSIKWNTISKVID